MNLFQSILSDLKKKIDAKHANTEVVARIISDSLGITIAPSAITKRGTHISLRIPATVKMRLTIKRQEILLALQKEGFSIFSIS